MKSLKEQLQDHEIGNLYLLFGDEKYLVRLNAGRIRSALLTQEDEMMNLEVFDGIPETDTFKVSVETLPFMAERRVILLKDSKVFSGKNLNAKAQESLEKILTNVPDTTTVIFQENEVDKRSRMYKLVQKSGQVFEFEHPEEGVLGKWITQELRRKKHTIAPNDLAYLLSLTGNDMEHIASEINKLASFAGDRVPINRNDIDIVISPTVEASIFKMTDNLCEGKKGAAFQIYKDLLHQSEPGQRIFFMIIRQFRMLYKTAVMGKTDPATLAKELSVPPFAAKNYQRQAARFGEEKLLKILEKLLELDVGIKSGEILPEEAIELMILSYSS